MSMVFLGRTSAYLPAPSQGELWGRAVLPDWPSHWCSFQGLMARTGANGRAVTGLALALDDILGHFL